MAKGDRGLRNDGMRGGGRGAGCSGELPRGVAAVRQGNAFMP